MERGPLTGWIPVHVDRRPFPPLVDWAYVGGMRLTAPFFDQSVGDSFRRPFSLLFRHRTTLDTLLAWRAASPGLEPSGFIAHMSRCGSTLVSQVLTALPRNVVLSEAPPLDAILRIPGLVEDSRIAGLRAMLSALGQRRHPEESRLYVKLDCWHTPALPPLRRAYPTVPRIFVYRRPLEVMASHARVRGLQVIPGYLDPAAIGLDPAAPPPPFEEYTARVLATICRAALSALDEGGLRLVNYSELPGAVWSEIARHFGESFSDAERDRMEQVSRLYAKNPVLPFEDDTSRKAAEVTDRMREVCDAWVEPLYQELERRRLAQDPQDGD